MAERGDETREGESRQTRMGGGAEKVEKRLSGKEAERTQSPSLLMGPTFQACEYQLTRAHICKRARQKRDVIMFRQNQLSLWRS